MNSPITGKRMRIVREKETLNFRKEHFDVMYHYYLCVDSDERFTDDYLDNLNLKQVTNQYRERCGIPFPEEIRQIREKYGVSASKMSEILGLGVNTYRLYESGEMPTVANGRLILSVTEPEEFLRQVQASNQILSEREQQKFTDLANELISKQQYEIGHNNSQIYLRDDAANSYNGYRRLSLSRVSQVISFFDKFVDSLYKTKLNKLLFYTDFLAYKNQGHSITGLQYRAIPYGPVPSEYDRLFLRMQDDEQIRIEEKEGADDQYFEVMHSLVAFDREAFSEKEMHVLDAVVQMSKDKKTRDLVNFSHEEKAWLENSKHHTLIDYQKYAFDVRLDIK